MTQEQQDVLLIRSAIAGRDQELQDGVDHVRARFQELRAQYGAEIFGYAIALTGAELAASQD